MRKTAIFDLDGTLLDTLEDLHDSTNFALKSLGFPQRTLEEIRNFVGNGLRSLMIRCLPDGSDAVDAVLAEMKRHYATNCHNKTRPYDGILPLLEALHTAGFRLAIVSNKADLMVQLLREVYFADLIPVAVGELPGVLRKPAPDMVDRALLQLGAERSDAVYIGDSEVDIRTAENAGLPCLSVCWGFRSEDLLLEHGAQTLCRTPQSLLEALMNL